ncbi:hypothetical protein BFINE_12580 [Bacteroides finegoldii DSM 17565]|nr:hypothetical protein BFINE_12580 [Bacteroides finegoldii DSM 17565]
MGGAHLELGEHMLTTEYFPNSSLAMKGELKKAMVTYYDFITGYENLLRDGGEFYGVTASSTDGKMTVNQWPLSVIRLPLSGNALIVGT